MLKEYTHRHHGTWLKYVLCTLMAVMTHTQIHAGSRVQTETFTRPNFLWITIEDTSPNEFSCYGNTDIQTPEVDELARRGVLFTRATATAPHCSPARSTLITGCYATTYGMDVHREKKGENFYR